MDLKYKMGEGGQREHRRFKMENFKGRHPSWNLLSQYQSKEQNTFFVNTKIGMLYAERDAIIEEWDRALSEKKAALEERDVAIQHRDIAIAERDKALKERDNSLAALQFQQITMNDALGHSIRRSSKHGSHSTPMLLLLNVKGICK